MKNSLSQLFAPYNTIAITGVAKNVGKTTALNQLIKEFEGQPIKGFEGHLALTSIGLDGEEIDNATQTPKPRIFVSPGTIIATAQQLLTQRKNPPCDITKEILAATNIQTPLGQVVIARALSSGYVQLAGPSSVQQLLGLIDNFNELGAAKIIIDGAAGRKSLAAPHIAQATLLCTGASAAGSMEQIAEITSHTVKLMQLQKIKTDPSSNNHIHIKGAVTNAILMQLITSGKAHNKTIVAENATKLLIDPKTLNKLALCNGRLAVEDAINLVAVAINPTTPYGQGFCPRLFLDTMQKVLNVPVFDVRL